MRPKALQVILTGAVLTAGSLIGVPEAPAQRCLPHRATTCNRCCLPSYDYALHAERVSASLVAVASVDKPIAITQYVVDTKDEGVRQPVLA